MNILLDEQIPQELRYYLPGHDVRTARYVGWDGKENGELLALARNEFDVLITMDRRLPREQNISETDVAIVVLRARSNRIQDLRPLVPILVDRLYAVERGQVVQIQT